VPGIFSLIEKNSFSMAFGGDARPRKDMDSVGGHEIDKATLTVMESAAKGEHGSLTVLQGTALYIGAVLGTGIIALPALAAQVAGPASLLAWLALVLLSALLAATFAALGARYPDAGGVSTYVGSAFGSRAAAIVGWCFYFAMPPGAPAAAMFGGAYVAAARELVARLGRARPRRRHGAACDDGSVPVVDRCRRRRSIGLPTVAAEVLISNGDPRGLRVAGGRREHPGWLRGPRRASAVAASCSRPS
jgi:hypothetical protein